MVKASSWQAGKRAGEGGSGMGRKKFGEKQNIELVSEVGGRCPKCGKKLVNKRASRLHKDYELAHIYPLNPSEEEIKLLDGLQRLSEDPNEERNIIALCLSCHNIFDNPRTVAGYLEMCRIKMEILRRIDEQESWLEFPLSEQISRVLRSLGEIDIGFAPIPLEYDPRTVDSKTSPEIPFVKRSRIKSDVQYYYTFIRRELFNIECEVPGTSQKITLQTKLYYTELVSKGYSKIQIYDAIAQWIQAKTHIDSLQIAEIVTSFFVQNCEVFEVAQ